MLWCGRRSLLIWRNRYAKRVRMGDTIKRSNSNQHMPAISRILDSIDISKIIIIFWRILLYKKLENKFSEENIDFNWFWLKVIKTLFWRLKDMIGIAFHTILIIITVFSIFFVDKTTFFYIKLFLQTSVILRFWTISCDSHNSDQNLREKTFQQKKAIYFCFV